MEEKIIRRIKIEKEKDKAIDCLNYVFNLELLDDDTYTYIETNIMNMEDN